VVRLLARRQTTRPDLSPLKMPQAFNPREAARGILQSSAPTRPLFLPIVFSLGARIENVSFRNYLTNPTKISNALRQIRTHLRSDGMTCYFDPFLESEALGGVLDWQSRVHRPTLRWPQPSLDGELPEGLCSPEETAHRGRVPIAAEVIKRLKPVVRDDFLLMAGITGPFTLAAQLAQIDPRSLPSQSPPDSALHVAADVVPVVARTLVEAGANVIFIREELLPSSSAAISDWASQLLPTVNIVRFYEALPVLLPGSSASAAQVSEDVKNASTGAVMCAPVDLEGSPAGKKSNSAIGIALPAAAFDPVPASAAEIIGHLKHAITELSPAIVTTSSDVAPTADLKYLNAIAEELNR
jgi:hypothetical protein